MKEDQHPPEATGKKRSTSPEKDRKHSAYAALLKQGLTKSHAAKALGYSTGSIGMLDNAIEKKNLTSSVSCDSNARIARRAVRLLAQAKTFGCIETVRAADVLRASEIILDRAEPKIQAVAPPSRSFIQTNLNIFLPDPPPAPREIDLEPVAIDEPPEGDSVKLFMAPGSTREVGRSRPIPTPGSKFEN